MKIGYGDHGTADPDDGVVVPALHANELQRTKEVSQLLQQTSDSNLGS